MLNKIKILKSINVFRDYRGKNKRSHLDKFYFSNKMKLKSFMFTVWSEHTCIWKSFDAQTALKTLNI